MEIFAFILIGGIWAAFLLPSFFASRKRAPRFSTRSFARDNALLGSVATSSTAEVAARRRASSRRQRTLMLLILGAVVTLVLAIMQNSLPLLGVSILFDLSIAGFVTMLLYHKRRKTLPPPTPVVAIEEASGPDPQRHTVRVVAG